MHRVAGSATRCRARGVPRQGSAQPRRAVQSDQQSAAATRTTEAIRPAESTIAAGATIADNPGGAAGASSAAAANREVVASSTAVTAVADDSGFPACTALAAYGGARTAGYTAGAPGPAGADEYAASAPGSAMSAELAGTARTRRAAITEKPAVPARAPGSTVAPVGVGGAVPAKATRSTRSE